jgi:hypothetical protein
MKKFQRFCLLWALLNLILLLTGCGWVTQAASIINLLIPAIQAALALLAAFGVGVSPTVLASVQKWGQEAARTLTDVVNPLIDEYKQAIDSAKGDVLNKIQAALQVTIADLGNILPSLHVTNPATESKIRAVFELLMAQLVALINVLPAIEGKVSHREAAKLAHAVIPPEDFKKEFNRLTREFGAEFQI